MNVEGRWSWRHQCEGAGEKERIKLMKRIEVNKYICIIYNK
jgi:hypothetical protein